MTFQQFDNMLVNMQVICHSSLDSHSWTPVNLLQLSQRKILHIGRQFPERESRLSVHLSDKRIFFLVRVREVSAVLFLGQLGTLI